jgi:hypothetical protein
MGHFKSNSRQPIYCEKCKRTFKGGISSRHYRKGCSKQIHEITYKECKYCKRTISSNNLKRHQDKCDANLEDDSINYLLIENIIN